jgi:hypothetical protein
MDHRKTLLQQPSAGRCGMLMTLGLAVVLGSAGCGARTPPPAAVEDTEPLPPEAAMTPEEAAKALKAQPQAGRQTRREYR